MNPYLEIVIRSIGAFALMMMITRILGKATIAQMTYHDFVAAITLGGITANFAFNLKVNVWHLLVALVTFSGVAFILLVFVLKSRTFRRWISGQPAVLVQDGKILEHNMKKLRMTLDSLNQELREKNIFNIEEVEYAVLELNGKVSALLKKEYLPVTRKDLGLKGHKQEFPTELIMDGNVVEDNLKYGDVSQAWLMSQLEKRRLSIEEVSYAVKGTNGQFYCDLYQDGVSDPIDEA